MEIARQPSRPEAAAPEFSTSEQLRAHYRAVKARMGTAPPLPVAYIPKPPPKVPEPPPGIDEFLDLLPPPKAAPEVISLPEGLPLLSRPNILRVVAKVAKVNEVELRSHLRARHLVRARFVYFVLARKYSGGSLPLIGSYVGGRDHSTVLHGLRMGAKLFRELYPIYREACAILNVPIPDVREFLEYKK